MKTLNKYIIEGLKINSKTKVIGRDLKNWTIENAEDGDLVEMPDINIVFLYKCLNTKKEIQASPKAIIYHAYYIYDDRKRLVIKTDTGVGTVDEENTNTYKKYRLASETLTEEFFQSLRERGYKWDNSKKELVRI